MDTKPKARGPSKERPVQVQEKTQRERFIEAARAIEADETGAKFERALDAIVRQKRA